MAKKSRYTMKPPVEKHDTATGTSVKRRVPGSNFAIPTESQVENAREWVNMNKK